MTSDHLLVLSHCFPILQCPGLPFLTPVHLAVGPRQANTSFKGSSITWNGSKQTQPLLTVERIHSQLPAIGWCK